MRTKTSKKLALLLPYAVNIRDICYSGALKKLSNTTGLIVDIYTQEPNLVPRHENNVYAYPLIEYNDSWLDSQLKKLFTIFIYRHSCNYQALIELKSNPFSNTAQLAWHGFIFILFRLILLTNIHKTLLILSFLLSNRVLCQKKYFKASDYDIVVSSRSVINSLEYGYMLEAFLSRTKLVLAAGSWDNFTTKAFVDFDSSLILVWNKKMVRELKRLYGFSEKKVSILGFPRFSQLVKHISPTPPTHQPSTAFKILICLSYEELTKCLDDEMPAEFINALNLLESLNEFPWDCKRLEVIIRFHPFTKSDYANLFKRLTVHLNFSVQLYIPGISKRYFENFMSPDEDYVYTSQLQNANVVISCGSTVAIDAMVLRKPQINIGWDPPGLSDSRPITRLWKFPHLKSFAAFTKLKVYHSSSEALEDIVKCITNQFNDPVDYDAFAQLYVPNVSTSSYSNAFSASITDLL